MPRHPEHRDRLGIEGLVVWLLLAVLLGAAFPYFEKTRNANELPRQLQAIAWVDADSWSIRDAGLRIDPGPDIARGQGGAIVPNKPPGTTVVLAAAYRVARSVHGDELDLRRYTWWSRLFTGWLPTVVLAGVLLVRITRAHGRTVAMGAVVIYGLGTPAAAYAHLAYGHQLAATTLFIGSMLCIDAVLGTGRRSSVGGRMAIAVVGGALAGTAVLVEYGAVFAGLPLGLVLLARMRDKAAGAAVVGALGGALVPIVVLARYHDLVFGSPWQTGYHHVTNADFAAKHGQGLLGLTWPHFEALRTHLLAPDTGLLWWMPLAFLGAYGLARHATTVEEPGRSEARFALGVVIVYLVVVSGLVFDGGWRIGPRYLVVILPMLALGIADVLAHARTHPVWLAVVVALSLYGLVVNVLAADLWPHLDPTNVHRPVAEVLLPLWRAEVTPYAPMGTRALPGLHALVIGSVVFGVAAVLRSMEVTVATMAGALGGIVLGFGLVGLATLGPAHPKGERNLAYILGVWEPSGDALPESRRWSAARR